MKTLEKNAIVVYNFVTIWRMKKFIMKMLLSKHPKVIWCLRNLVPMVLFPVANFYLFEWYLNNPWKEMKVPIQFLNIYLFELLMALFLCVFGRLKWSLRLQSIFFYGRGSGKLLCYQLPLCADHAVGYLLSGHCPERCQQF